MNQGMNHASSLSDYHNVYWIWMFTFASFIHHCLSFAESLSQLRLGRRRFTPWTCCKFIIGLHLSTIIVLTSIAYKAKAWWSDYSVPTCQQSNNNKKKKHYDAKFLLPSTPHARECGHLQGTNLLGKNWLVTRYPVQAHQSWATDGAMDLDE